MKKVLVRLKKTYMNFRISTKLSVLYLFVFLLSMFLSWIVYYNLNYRFSIQKSGELSMQTLYSLKSNITNLLQNVDYNSRVILSNNDVQTILSNGQEEDTFVAEKKMKTILTLLINTMPSIESIYVFDNYGHFYGAGRGMNYSLKLSSITGAPWYKQVVNLRGASLFQLHANNIFSAENKDSSVSMVRLINGTVSQRPIGILLMNISNSALEESYHEIVKKYGSNVILLNESNEYIISNESIPKENVAMILKNSEENRDAPIILKSGGKRFIYSSITLDSPAWKIIMGIPMEEIDKELALYQRITFIIIFLNIILLLGGIMISSRLITVPIHKLLESMRGVQKGNFVTVNMNTGADEIGQLKDGYNLMITKIQELLNKTINDQRAKRKLELNILQAQIKPHFLYNTLDAMAYLSLAGKNAELYDALEALGEFYRKSLSKGEEIISIKDEVDITRDYLFLQRLRYGDIFTAKFDIDDDVLKYKTLKLVLQPLVENSIYHGIRPKGEPGEILVRVKGDGDRIILSVEDNGIGMSDDVIKAIQNGDIKGSGFGLCETLERLRIYYESDSSYTIKSSKNEGTIITISIPKETSERERTKNDGIQPRH
ncbi:sensor histidine kinase [Thermocaproicibacter melissae]|uniref:sensor histidine kinase n=1 Tax=Thermocaproicibacter melissae TaxID=2966552 RepID=UPI0024B07A7A|nr:sensor histidine kinase [Thermocaproicibacter melissae]WBY64930.1 sensor histidine kinase [Thermocaproicibacter melissae]